MAEGELKDMELFFSTLQTPFTAFESEAYKTSVVGGLSAMGLMLVVAVGLIPRP